MVRPGDKYFLFALAGVPVLMAVAFVIAGLTAPAQPQRAPSVTAGPRLSYPHFKEDVIACTSETALKQYTTAAVQKDQAGSDYLVEQRRCLSPKSDLRISLLDRPGLGTVHVRVYTDAGSAELWAYVEGVEGI